MKLRFLFIYEDSIYITYFHNKIQELANLVKSEFSESLNIIGGPHSSGVREFVLKKSEFDYGFAL